MFKGKEKNWLLIVGGLGLSLTLIVFLVLGSSHSQAGSRNYSCLPLGFVVFSALIIAPIIEELVFRGFFCAKKSLRRIAFIGLPIFVLVNSTNYGVYLAMLLFVVLFLVRKNKLNSNLAIVCNALIFALVHYKISGLTNIYTAYQPLSQFSAGLLLTWVVLNYNIYKAMLFHFCWNALFMLLLFSSLLFPNTDTVSYSNDLVVVEWSQVERYNSSKSSLNFSDSSLTATNIEARNLFKLLKGVDDNQESNRIVQRQPYMKYNIFIRFKDSLPQNEIRTRSAKLLKELNLVNEIAP